MLNTFKNNYNCIPSTTLSRPVLIVYPNKVHVVTIALTINHRTSVPLLLRIKTDIINCSYQIKTKTKTSPTDVPHIEPISVTHLSIALHETLCPVTRLTCWTIDKLGPKSFRIGSNNR